MRRSRIPAIFFHSRAGNRTRVSSGTFFAASPMISVLRTNAPLHQSAWLHQHCRLGAETEAAAEEQIRIATDQGFPFWHATGTLYRAAGLLLQGKVETGLALLENGLKAYRAAGAGLGLPYYLSILAEACIQAGRFNEARLALDEALALVEKNDEHF